MFEKASVECAVLGRWVINLYWSDDLPLSQLSLLTWTCRNCIYNGITACSSAVLEYNHQGEISLSDRSLNYIEAGSQLLFHSCRR